MRYRYLDDFPCDFRYLPFFLVVLWYFWAWIPKLNIFQVSNFPAILLELRGCLHEKTRTGMSFIPTYDFLISYRVYMMTGLFHMSFFEGTLHVD